MKVTCSQWLSVISVTPTQAAAFGAAPLESSTPAPSPSPTLATVSGASQGDAGGPAVDQAPPAGCEYKTQMFPPLLSLSSLPPGAELQFSSVHLLNDR